MRQDCRFTDDTGPVGGYDGGSWARDGRKRSPWPVEDTMKGSKPASRGCVDAGKGTAELGGPLRRIGRGDVGASSQTRDQDRRVIGPRSRPSRSQAIGGRSRPSRRAPRARVLRANRLHHRRETREGPCQAPDSRSGRDRCVRGFHQGVDEPCRRLRADPPSRPLSQGRRGTATHQASQNAPFASAQSRP